VVAITSDSLYSSFSQTRGTPKNAVLDKKIITVYRPEDTWARFLEGLKDGQKIDWPQP